MAALVTTIEALRALEARLAEAKGADREIDHDLSKSLIFNGGKTHTEACEEQMRGDPKLRKKFSDTEIRRQSLNTFVYRYTKSLDAAVSLAERVLPGWCRMIQNCGIVDHSKCYAIVGPDQEDARHSAEAATEAMALCLAVIRALIAKEPADGR